ncbi:MAG TPA: hypothetical protein VEQ84_08185 [Vicinamibacteria bacterium]|nr:hypothetical protein [Vicinamibacteria bacterium]
MLVRDRTDVLVCPRGETSAEWLVMDVATGRSIALCSALDGCIAVAEGFGLDPEALFLDLLDREADRDAVAYAPVPAPSPPSAWAYFTGMNR